MHLHLPESQRMFGLIVDQFLFSSVLCTNSCSMLQKLSINIDDDKLK